MSLGLVAVLAIWVALFGLMVYAQTRFLRLYSSKMRRPGLISDRHTVQPWAWFADIGGIVRTSAALADTRLDDPELEKLRRAYVLSRWTFLGSFIALLIIGFLFFSTPNP